MIAPLFTISTPLFTGRTVLWDCLAVCALSEGWVIEELVSYLALLRCSEFLSPCLRSLLPSSFLPSLSLTHHLMITAFATSELQLQCSNFSTDLLLWGGFHASVGYTGSKSEHTSRAFPDNIRNYEVHLGLHRWNYISDKVRDEDENLKAAFLITVYDVYVKEPK